MNILMLTPYLPYPIWSGGQIRTYNLLKNLSKKHSITLFSFIREEKERAYVSKLKEYCKNVHVFPKRPPWSIESLTNAAVTFYPLVVCMYLNKRVYRAIEKVTKQEHFDLIHAETFYVMPNLPSRNIPTILVEQTIEFLVYKHFIRSVTNPLKKILMNWDVFKIRYWEKTYWQRATRVVAMSDADREVMQRLIPALTVDLVPNGVDLEHFTPKQRMRKVRQKKILFVGNFKWLQNREAVSILIRDVFPIIKKQVPDVKLCIVGRSPTQDILQLKSQSIEIFSDIEDIRKAYQDADVLIAPIYGPGGTRYKILESMAVGLPVVTTTTGIEGLGAIHGEDVLVGNTPQELAHETIRLLTDWELYRKLSNSGRKLVEKRFNWKTIADSLDSIYQDAAYGKSS